MYVGLLNCSIGINTVNSVLQWVFMVQKRAVTVTVVEAGMVNLYGKEDEMMRVSLVY